MKQYIKQGIAHMTRSGDLYVSFEDSPYDVHVPVYNTKGAIEQDLVTVKFIPDIRPEGSVISIDHEYYTTIVGTLTKLPVPTQPYIGAPTCSYICEPDNQHICLNLFVSKIGNAKEGDKVEVTLPKRQPLKDSFVVEVIRSFGSSLELRGNYGAILAEHQIETIFSEKVREEAQAIKAPSEPDDNRVDLRSSLILTIDGSGSKDLDDAVSLELLKNGNWLLGVHIADVSHFVKPHTALDECAASRGSSIYFIDQVVPMLPEELSNGVCSLNPKEDKLALSCLMEFTQDGTHVHTELVRSVIQSKIRGVYEEVNDLFQKEEQSDFYSKYAPAYTMLKNMLVFSRVLRYKADLRGYISLGSSDIHIVLNEKGEPKEIVPCVSGDAEQLIEQFMLAANECVATLLKSKGIPCVYRVHDLPDEDKINTLVSDLLRHGISLPPRPKKQITSLYCQAVLDSIHDPALLRVTSFQFLRAMSKAVYSAECTPHFGLALDCYCHFTSPIRRYSDLATHRILKACLFDGEPSSHYAKFAEYAADKATEGEERALKVERKIESLYKTLYLASHIGEEAPAFLTHFMQSGVFAELDNTCEGFISEDSILDCGWKYDDRHGTIEAKGHSFTVGSIVKIKIVQADITTCRVEFAFDETKYPKKKQAEHAFKERGRKGYLKNKTGHHPKKKGSKCKR